MPTFSVPHLLWIELLKTGNLPHILTPELGLWYFSFISTPTFPQLSNNGDSFLVDVGRGLEVFGLKGR